MITFAVKNSGAINLAHVGLTASWLAGMLADEIWVNFRFSAFNKVTALLEQYECIYLSGIFTKWLFKVVVRSVKYSGSHTFSCY